MRKVCFDIQVNVKLFFVTFLGYDHNAYIHYNENKSGELC